MKHARIFGGIAAALLVATATPAVAHEPWDDGSIPPPPPASPADGVSKNMKLLSTAQHTGGVNSDLAFKGTLAFAGHYGGFRVIDLADPGSPVEIADVHCNGPQGDVTVHGDLLFLSVDTPQSTVGCEGSKNVTAKTAGAFEGVRIFDISDPAAPEFLQGVRTDCGSHTNTLVPGEGDTAYVYVASYPLSASGLGPDCQAPFEKISVIEVDGDDAAAVLFGDSCGTSPTRWRRASPPTSTPPAWTSGTRRRSRPTASTSPSATSTSARPRSRTARCGPTRWTGRPPR